MKYPFVIFYRKEKYSNIDNFFIDNAINLNCSVFIANNIEHVKNLHNSNFHLLITYGDSHIEYQEELLTIISDKMLIRYIHSFPKSDMFKDINTFNININSLYINLCSLDRSKIRPTFSLFTPSYNSYEKILRVYKSLQKQTLLDWEWIIIDDSPDDKNFFFFKKQIY